MRKLAIIIMATLIAGVAQASTWDVRSHSLTSSVPVSADSRAVVGELDSVSVYFDAGVTGTVSVAIIDPYRAGQQTVVATNADTTGFRIWRPRLAAVGTTGIDGATSLSVTNAGDRIILDGETVRATISAVSDTNAVVRFRVKVKK